MKSRPRKHARKEGFKSISSNASTICHKTSSKLFLIIDILHLVHFFKICFNRVLPLFTESSVNWSSKHVFVRRNCKELWANLRRWYLVNGHGDLFFLFYISKHCTVDNNLWKFDRNRMLNFISGGMTLTVNRHIITNVTANWRSKLAQTAKPPEYKRPSWEWIMRLLKKISDNFLE